MAGLRQDREDLRQIAAEDRIGIHIVQQSISYAFLAPDLIRQIIEGRQPPGLTSQWIRRHPLSMDWAEQRVIIASL